MFTNKTGYVKTEGIKTGNEHKSRRCTVPKKKEKKKKDTKKKTGDVKTENVQTGGIIKDA